MLSLLRDSNGCNLEFQQRRHLKHDKDFLSPVPREFTSMPWGESDDSVAVLVATTRWRSTVVSVSSQFPEV